MKKISELKNQLDRMFAELEIVLNDSAYKKYGSLYLAEEGQEDADIEFFCEECTKILEKLEWLKDDYEYLSRPVIAEGILEKQDNGRYAVDGIELTCGKSVEVWYKDECEPGTFKWVKSHVESRGDYYIVALGSEKKIAGLRVRIR